MEQLAKEAEEMSAYKMNSDVVSDTEEWHKRKTLLKNKNQDLSSEYIVDAISCWLIISLEYSFMINLLLQYNQIIYSNNTVTISYRTCNYFYVCQETRYS